jgi:hypothetical protein
MDDYNLENNKFVKNGLDILEGLLTETERLRIDRITDDPLLRFLDFFKSEIEKVKKTIVVNPRFDFGNIQEQIDGLYAKDPSTTGVMIRLDWRDGNKRALLNYRIKKD